jgi:hypothetical protein
MLGLSFVGKATFYRAALSPEYVSPHETDQLSPGANQCNDCPVRSAFGGAVIGSTATAVANPPSLGNLGVVKI